MLRPQRREYGTQGQSDREQTRGVWEERFRDTRVCVKDISTLLVALRADGFDQIYVAHCGSTKTGYREAPPLAEEPLAVDGCWGEGGRSVFFKDGAPGRQPMPADSPILLLRIAAPAGFSNF